MDKVSHIGENVVVVGGSATGCETAQFIASMGTPEPDTFTFLIYHSAEDPEFATKLLHDAGRRITVIDMVPRFANNVGRTARWSLMKGLRLMGVELRKKTKLLEITDDAVIVETEEGKTSLKADTVVMAVGVLPDDELARHLEEDGIKVITIGDAKKPRKMTDAIWEGFEEALKISQPAVSKHLKLLEDGGLVGFKKDGLWVNYYLTDGASSPYVASLLGNLRHWLEKDPEVADLIEKLPSIRREEICKR